VWSRDSKTVSHQGADFEMGSQW